MLKGAELEFAEPTRVELTPIPTAQHFFFWKGRVALYGILKALSIGPGDCVLVPGYTCVVVPGAVRFLGAEPIYVDIDPDTYNISLDAVEAALATGNRCVKAIVVQHTYGLPVDTAPIVVWAGKKGIAVIEDCCHSVGSRYSGSGGCWHDVGTLGDAAFFSSQWSKPVSTGLGGWVVTRSSAIESGLRKFAEQECISPSTLECLMLAAQLTGRAIFSSPRFFWFAQSTLHLLTHVGLAIGSSVEEELQGTMPRGYAKRMSGLQRRLLRNKILHFLDGLDRRRDLKRTYDRALEAAGLPILKVPSFADPVLLRYPVRVPLKAEMLQKARNFRIELGDWFNHPLHPKTSESQAFGYQSGMCPNAELAAQQVVNLPMHEKVTDEMAAQMVSFLKSG